MFAMILVALELKLDALYDWFGYAYRSKSVRLTFLIT